MDNKWQFRSRLIKISVVVVTFFSLCAITAMTVYAANKVVILENGEILEEEPTEVFVGNIKWKYDLWTDDSTAGQIVIPLKSDVTENGIIAEVKYNEKSVTVSFSTDNADYYKINTPFGDSSYIKEAYGEYDGETVRLQFSFSESLICKTSYNNLIHGNEFVLSLTPCDEMSETVVFIDPEHGGKSAGTTVGDLVEKDILLKIAKKVEKLSEGKQYTVVLSRTADTYISTEEKVKMVSAISPDYYLGIELSSDADNTKDFGMSATYNEGYYRRGIQNVTFADAILKNTCKKTSNRGNGLFAATEEDVILMTMDVPGAVLYAGYLSNSDECRLLGTDEYLDRIAEGIIEGIDQIIE